MTILKYKLKTSYKFQKSAQQTEMLKKLILNIKYIVYTDHFLKGTKKYIYLEFFLYISTFVINFYLFIFN